MTTVLQINIKGFVNQDYADSVKMAASFILLRDNNNSIFQELEVETPVRDSHGFFKTATALHNYLLQQIVARVNVELGVSTVDVMYVSGSLSGTTYNI